MKLTILATLLTLFSNTTLADNYPAKNCEVFVDQVAAWSGTYGYRGVSLSIKTLNARLDGKIKRVAFFGQAQATDSAKVWCAKDTNGGLNDCNRLGQWRDFVAQPFYSEDYFVVHFELRHQATYEHIFEGAVYVETEKGTRYWVNPAGGGNFFIDENMRSDLIRLGSGGYYLRGKMLNTADKFNYLNPGLCR